MKESKEFHSTTPPTGVDFHHEAGRVLASWGEDSLTVRALGAGLFDVEHWTEEASGRVQQHSALVSLYYGEDTTPVWRWMAQLEPLLAEIFAEAVDILAWSQDRAGENFPHWLRSMVAQAEARGASPTPMLAALMPESGWRFHSHTAAHRPEGCACVITTPRGYYYTTERVRCP